MLYFFLKEEEFPFRDLAIYALNCLLMPCSNSFVETIFSQVRYIKNKYRNRTMMPFLDALLTVKSTLQAGVPIIFYKFNIRKCIQDLTYFKVG